VVMGAPALVKEGLSWREVRLRALHSAPVSLSMPARPVESEA
jgi:phosphatidylinositol alpha-mannosyltransferase